jgi:DNA-binding transcriptional LysR family regulator
LAGRTRTGEIDAALVTEPTVLAEGLTCHAVANEPLALITPADCELEDVRTILDQQPYIQFSKNAWAGQQIVQHLLDLGIKTSQTMEIDSLEAIYRMVAHGLGVSIIPLNGATESMLVGIKTVILTEPALFRTLVVVERTANPRAALVAGIVEILRNAGKGGHISNEIPGDARQVL